MERQAVLFFMEDAEEYPSRETIPRRPYADKTFSKY